MESGEKEQGRRPGGDVEHAATRFVAGAPGEGIGEGGRDEGEPAGEIEAGHAGDREHSHDPGQVAEFVGQATQSGFEHEQRQSQPGDAEVFAGDETPDQCAEAHGREAGCGEAQCVALVPAETVIAAPECRLHEA